MEETEVQAALEEAAPEVVAEAGQAEGDKPEEGQPEEKSRSQARRERREAAIRHREERAKEESARVADLETRLKRIKDSADRQQAPSESDFPDVIEYAAARALWKQRQEDARNNIEEISAEVKAAREREDTEKSLILNERREAFEEQAAEAKSRYTDFDQVMQVAARADVVSEPVAEMILLSDRPADLAYYLGARPELARRISALPPVHAAREIGRIEAILSVPASKTETKAPDPINPVRGSGTPSKDPGKMTAGEYRKWRESGGRF